MNPNQLPHDDDEGLMWNSDLGRYTADKAQSERLARLRDDVLTYNDLLSKEKKQSGLYYTCLKRDRDKALLEIAKIEGDEQTATDLQQRIESELEYRRNLMESMGYKPTF